MKRLSTEPREKIKWHEFATGDARYYDYNRRYAPTATSARDRVIHAARQAGYLGRRSFTTLMSRLNRSSTPSQSM